MEDGNRCTQVSPLIVIFNRKKEREEFLNTDLSREFPDRREII